MNGTTATYILEHQLPEVGLKVVMFNIIGVKITIPIYFLKSCLKEGPSKPFKPPSLRFWYVSLIWPSIFAVLYELLASIIFHWSSLI